MSTQLEKSRTYWKSTYQQFGKGSKEEIAAYREYVKVQQGEGKSKNKAYLKGKKERKQKEV